MGNVQVSSGSNKVKPIKSQYINGTGGRGLRGGGMCLCNSSILCLLKLGLLQNQSTVSFDLACLNEETHIGISLGYVAFLHIRENFSRCTSLKMR